MNFLPDWIAPNVITLTGFLVMLIPIITLFTVFGTSLGDEEKKPLPQWIFFLQAICFMGYRMLDEMDGKQARRTGNSSPLGMLFDHGCDSIAVGVQGTITAKLLGCGDNWVGFLPIVACNSTFFFAMVEEYYKGILVLPLGNGISDGSIVQFWFFISLGIWGNKWATVPILNLTGTPLAFNDMCAIGLIAGQLFTISNYIMNVLRTPVKLPDGMYGEKFTWSLFL